MFQHSKPVYELGEGFDLLGIGRAHGYKEIKAGRLRIIKNGRRTLIPCQAVDDYIALLERESEEKAA